MSCRDSISRSNAGQSRSGEGNEPLTSTILHAPCGGERPSHDGLIYMQTRTLTIPELAFIVGTRGALGAGIGLLLSERLTAQARRAAGLTLVAIGAITTIPAAMAVFGRGSRFPEALESAP
jgi:hypothetical protein